MKTSFIFASVARLASALQTRGQSPANLAERAVVNMGPAGVCPAVPTVTAELQPVYCCKVCPCPTSAPFRNGVAPVEPHVLSGSCSTSTITRIIGPTSLATATATLSSSSSVISRSVVPDNSLTIGQGLLKWTINNLPNSNFIFLAVSVTPTATPSAKRHDHVRRQQPASTFPLAVVNLDQPTVSPGGFDQDRCDNASPLLYKMASTRMLWQSNGRS
jgi:hypothetical protein